MPRTGTLHTIHGLCRVCIERTLPQVCDTAHWPLAEDVLWLEHAAWDQARVFKWGSRVLVFLVLSRIFTMVNWLAVDNEVVVCVLVVA